jgi:hypothetical protein
MRTLLALIAFTGVARADAIARDADAWCDGDRAEHEFTVDKHGRWSPTTDPSKQFSVVWQGTLDRDHRRDVILDEGGCGTRECVHAAYVRCAGGAYARVFYGYAARVRVKPRARGWARLEVEHVGELERDGSRPRFWSRLAFGANGYD